MRIALFGGFGTGNLGNDATLAAMLTNLRPRLPTADFYCVCPDPPAVRKRYSLPAVPIDPGMAGTGDDVRAGRILRLGKRALVEPSSWSATGDFLRTVDHLIVAGTGILDDFGVRAWNMPYDLYRWCRVARRVRTRLSFVSVGAGPILHPASRWLMVEALRSAQYRSYRDQLSREYLASVGFFDHGDQVFPDLAFSLPDTHERGWRPAAYQLQTIGVGVMGYYGWRNSQQHGAHIYDEYVAKIGRFTAWLLEQGYAVHLLTGEIPTDQRPVQDVLQYLRSAVDLETRSRVRVPEIIAPDDVFAAIAATDLVVATRFHNVISALLLGRPVLSLGYSKKNDVLLAEMGMGQYCQAVGDFSVEKLQQQFQALAARAGETAANICSQVNSYRALLHAQYDRLAALPPLERH
jgi:polysaccharide pyruvyl transferase WcaK-like protein